MAASESRQARETSRINETETGKSAEGEQEMALAQEMDSASGCGQLTLSPLCHFQKENLVITIKRPYYIADFLEKSVFYWAGLQMHTHPVGHNTLK